MAVPRAWGPSDPNTTHQRWSGWVFDIVSERLPSRAEVLDNARRFAVAYFRSAIGQVKVEVYPRARGAHYRIAVRIEGPDVHDPAYRARVEETWRERFARPGFGPTATLTMTTAQLLAGSPEDGRPASHLIVAPPVALAMPDTA